jgi:hypothetical protein
MLRQRRLQQSKVYHLTQSTHHHPQAKEIMLQKGNSTFSDFSVAMLYFNALAEIC